MPELLIPRSNLGFPSICVLTGDTEDVHAHEVTLDKRGAAVVWGAAGFALLVLLGWLGEQFASQHFFARLPMTLPISRRAHDRWCRARGIMFGVSAVAVILVWNAISSLFGLPVAFIMALPPSAAWPCLLAGILIPSVAFRLLLWQKQPWFCDSAGLIMRLWIPSAAAADAIHAHMKPLLERATRTSDRRNPSIGDA